MAIIVAFIGAAAMIGSVVVSHVLTRRKIQEVHVLVNDRLETALSDIEDLRDELRTERRKHK